jgi:phage gpG-like protein
MALSRFLALNSNAQELEDGLREFGDTMRGLDYVSAGLAKAAFKDIRDILMVSARTNITSGAFAALSPVTTEFKARKGLRSEVLQATGNLLAGLDGVSGNTWAKVLRGQAEWYAFLHDRGKGFSEFSVEGRDAKKSGAWYETSGRYGKKRWRYSSKSYGEAARPGATKFPQRQFMLINDAARAQIIARYEQLLDEALSRLPKGNVPLGLR